MFLVAMLLAVPSSSGSAAVLGAVHGSGTVDAFYIHSPGGSQRLQGLVADWTYVCPTECFVRFNATSSDFALAQNGDVTVLPAGEYEIREFRGVFSFKTNGPYDYEVKVSGYGSVRNITSP